MIFYLEICKPQSADVQHAGLQRSEWESGFVHLFSQSEHLLMRSNYFHLVVKSNHVWEEQMETWSEMMGNRIFVVFVLIDTNR